MLTEEDKHQGYLEMRLKHLEFFQGVIARMAGNSANLKNYLMALVAAMIGFAAAIQKPEVMLYCLPIVLGFSILDANYLRLERAFRDQYNIVRKEDMFTPTDFLISPSWTVATKWRSVYFSWSVAGFYWPVGVVLIALKYII